MGFSGYGLVPLNSFYILTGGLVGVSFKNGFNIYKKEIFTAISAKAVVTPIFSGVLAYVLFSGIRALVGDENFWIDSYSEQNINSNSSLNIIEFTDANTAFNLGIIGAFAAFLIFGYYLYWRLGKKSKEEKMIFQKQTSALEAEKEFFLEKLKYEQKTGENRNTTTV